MKKLNTLITAALFVATALQTTAQNIETKPWHVRRAYGSVNGGSGNSFAFQLHFENRWAAYASYSQTKKTAKDLPADYVRGINYIIIFGFEEPKPQDIVNSIDLGIGRVLSHNPSDKLWIMATASINICEYNKAKFTRKSAQDRDDFNYGLIAHSSGNYNYNYDKTVGIGATLGLQMNITLCRFVGIGTGFNMQVNTAGFIPGAWVGLNMGLIRPKKVHASAL